MELLIVLFIISTMSLLAVNHHHSVETGHFDFLNRYLLTQSEAILGRKSETCAGGVWFNEMGHVNMGRTISFGRHEVVIHLGNGYATYR